MFVLVFMFINFSGYTMSSLTLTLAQEEIAFTQRYAQLGFSSESEVVAAALRLLQARMLGEEPHHATLENSALENSATLYAEVYAEDIDLQELTASACTSLETENPA
ncbi:MAG: hypothetical protein EAZ92_02855 [Candidatus Kapaibacterium sp.]|nr:MAG: hypothetical protein EAZ92_02855 [Candidatus Kapabacteria bacterium]